MKISKFLAISAVALASQTASAQWLVIDTNNNIADTKPTAWPVYDFQTNAEKPQGWPVYDTQPNAEKPQGWPVYDITKDNVTQNASDIVNKFRESKQTNNNQLKNKL